MKFIFMIICFQACMLIGSDENNKELAKNSKSASFLNSSTAAAFGSTPVSSQNENRSEEGNYAWLSSYQEVIRVAIEKGAPHLLPYLDLEILQLLAKSFDNQISDELKENYIMSLFMDTSEQVFSKGYKALCICLAKGRFNGNMPFDFQISENDLYKKIIIETLKECLNKISLQFDENLSQNKHAFHSCTLTAASLEKLNNTMHKKLENLFALKIQEYYDKTYTGYSSEKTVGWIEDAIKEKSNIKHGDLTIIRRIGYDIDQLAIVNVRKEEQGALENPENSVKLSNQEQKNIEEKKKAPEEGQRQLFLHYEFFQKMIFEKIYTAVREYSKKYTLNIKDEEINDLITTIFKDYCFNIFHFTPCGQMLPTSPFLTYIDYSLISLIKSLAEQKQKEAGQSCLVVPDFVFEQAKETILNIQELNKKQLIATAFSLIAIQHKELAEKKEKENQRILQETAARVEQKLLEHRTKEKKEEEEKRLRQEKFAEKKVEKEETKRAIEQQLEQEKIAKQQRKAQQNCLRQPEILKLQQQKNDTLILLADKERLVAESRSKAIKLCKGYIITLIDQVDALIKKQKKMVDSFNNKTPKKVREESQLKYEEIDECIKKIEELLRNAESSQDQDRNSTSLVTTPGFVQEEEGDEDSLVRRFTCAAVGTKKLEYSNNDPLGKKDPVANPSLHQSKAMNTISQESEHYVAAVVVPSFVQIRRANPSDSSIDLNHPNYDSFAQKATFGNTSQGSRQELLAQGRNLPVSNLGWAFYPERYQRKKIHKNNGSLSERR